MTPKELAAANALSCFLALPCFFSFFFFAYESVLVVIVWLFGKTAKGIVKGFSWPVRDGLTVLWACNRSKWQPLRKNSVGDVSGESGNVYAKGSNSGPRRPQVWSIVYRPLADDAGRSSVTLPRRSTLKVADSGKSTSCQVCCNRFCRQTGYHLSRLEMFDVSSSYVALNDTVNLRVFSCLCVTRADIVPSYDRFVYFLKIFFCSLVSLTFGVCTCLVIFIAYGYNFDSHGEGIESFVFWPLIISFSLFLLAFVFNCLYLRLERYPVRFAESCLYNVEELFNVDQNGRLDFETGNSRSPSNDESTGPSDLRLDLPESLESEMGQKE